MPVSTVPKTSTPLELPELLEELGMVPEQALSASVATVAARVSHLRIVHLLARNQRGPCTMVACGPSPPGMGGYPPNMPLALCHQAKEAMNFDYSAR